MLSLWIVLIFESAKIGTVIVYERGYFAGENNYTDSFKFTVRLFKYLLFILSFICSLAIFSLSLDRPNLEKTKAEDIRQIEDRFARDKQILQNRYQAEISGITNRNGNQFDEEARQIQAYYAPKIENLEKELRKEMENTDSRGNFIGKRYREFMRQLNEVKAERDQKLAEANRRNQIVRRQNEQEISNREAAFRQKMTELSQWRSSEIQKITNNSYTDDERASNKLMTATLNTINDGLLSPIFNIEMRPVVFSTLFSLLVALLIELTIYISMSSVNLRTEESRLIESFKKKTYEAI